ncbi:pentatricopeptide repeat-containing protein-like isoform X3, mitochondrial [Iris pallida]|uniref:Pentatricopeptide repeat-containing protein-like isoform X3, mitochondrial n=1 Tax=Iris pallida TaxID=29817 RepID=A0AAX6FE24_IRIPA|nr:pentatricopeptide repeat-containing protein-like isoform X3, mitochondrial [Iris pallida]
MVRGGYKITRNPFLPHKTHKIPIKYFFSSSPNVLYPSSSDCNRNPLDEMSHRTSFASHSLRLLQENPSKPSIVASVHSLSLKNNTIMEISARTTLLTAYARAHDLHSSLALFDEAAASSRDLISWNSAISACVVNACYCSSITIFREMGRGFGEVDSTTLVIILSAMSRIRNLKCGEAIHGMALKRRFDSDVYLGNALIDMYAKCGDMGRSLGVFEEMEVKDVASWNSVMTGYLYNGYPMESALLCRQMSCSSVGLDQVSLSCVISACSCLEELSDLGEVVHAWVVKLGYDGTPHSSSISNSLISFYCRCGDVEAAEKVFQRLVLKNVISWNSMINGLVENGRLSGGLDLFRAIRATSEVQPDAVTLVTILPVCGMLNLFPHVKSIHGFAIRNDIEFEDPAVSNSLLDIYLKSDDLIYADFLFRTMPNKDLITWNTIILGYSQSDFHREEARILFKELLKEGLECSLATLLAILPSCNNPQDINFGTSIHCWELKYGFADTLSASNALILMYINCGDLMASSLLLKIILPVSDVVSWNTIIVGFVQNEHHKDALKSYEFMRCSLNIDPDPITLVSILSACGNLELLFYGQSLHGFMIRTPIGSDLRVKNALITMYFRCGDSKSSELVFNTNSHNNLCSWSCMISGFAQNRNGGKALEYFCHMTRSDIQPNDISLVGLLCACTQLGNLRLGREVNGYIFHFGHHDNVFISSALVDMYSKCGRLDIATRVFESSYEKSIASWNSMISAYGFHGHGKKAIKLFSKMSNMNVRPTKSTFIALLSACSHCGLVDEGWRHYKLMVEEFKLEAAVEHHVLVVDMLGRVGRLRKAYEFVMELGIRAESEVWGALLSACKDHGELEMGKSIAERLFFLEPKNTGYYVTLSNLYAYHGIWNTAEDVRSMIRDRRLMKPPGSSSIDVPI